ncbi:MAG: DHHW family protein [Acetivibrio sp.]
MRKKIRIILFIGLIFGGMLCNFFTKEKTFSEAENRFLAEKPVLTKENVLSGKFSEDYETYITDQFSYRDSWIRMKTLTERALLKQESNGVYFCKDGYLMEKQDTKVFESKQAKKNKKSVISFGNKMKKKFDKEHLKFIFVPTASEILQDKLPPFASPYPQKKLLKELKEKIGNDYVVDVNAELLKHKEEDVFYRTDHHWTAMGAYYAYALWAEEAGLSPLLQSEFEIEKASDTFLGTISSKVNMKLKPDEIFLYHKKNAPKYKVTYDMGTEVRDTLYDRKALEEKDKYKVYLGGNYGMVEIDTGLHTGRKLLVVKDSFAHSFVPLACNQFDTTYMIDLRYFNVGIEKFLEAYEVTDILVLYNTVNLVTDKNIWKFKG